MVKIIPTYQAVHMGMKLREEYEHAGSKDFNVLDLGTNLDGELEFKNRERYTCIPDLECCDKEDVVVLHSGYPRPNSSMVQLFWVLGSLKNPMKSEGKVNGKKKYKPMGIKMKSKHVFYLVPSYTKQDWPDRTGSVNAMREQMDICKELYGVDKFFFIDWHSQSEDWVNNYDFVNVSAMDELTKHARRKGYPDRYCVDIGPDKSTETKYGIQGIEKKNITSQKRLVNVEDEIKEAVKGKYVRVKDDFLLSGNTLIAAGEKFMEYGAKKIAALIPHVLDENGIVRVREKFDDTFVSNTVDTPYATVNVRDLVFDTIQAHI